LEGGPPFSPRFTGADLLRNERTEGMQLSTGRLPSMVRGSTRLRIPHDFVTSAEPDMARNQTPTTPDRQRSVRLHLPVWVIPFVAHTKGVSFDFFLGLLRCFHFPRLSSAGLFVQPGDNAAIPAAWVSPFGNPRVIGY